MAKREVVSRSHYVEHLCFACFHVNDDDSHPRSQCSNHTHNFKRGVMACAVLSSYVQPLPNPIPSLILFSPAQTERTQRLTLPTHLQSFPPPSSTSHFSLTILLNISFASPTLTSASDTISSARATAPSSPDKGALCLFAFADSCRASAMYSFSDRHLSTSMNLIFLKALNRDQVSTYDTQRR